MLNLLRQQTSAHSDMSVTSSNPWRGWLSQPWIQVTHDFHIFKQQTFFTNVQVSCWEVLCKQRLPLYAQEQVTFTATFGSRIRHCTAMSYGSDTWKAVDYLEVVRIGSFSAKILLMPPRKPFIFNISKKTFLDKGSRSKSTYFGKQKHWSYGIHSYVTS